MRRYAVLRPSRLTIAALGLLCCALVTLAGNTVKTARVAAAREKRPVYSVETDKKLVSLGINCAWDNADIPRLLAVLKERDVKATFFVLGQWCDRYPESVRQIADAGHEIGSHSNTHMDLTKLSSDSVLEEIRASAEKIENLTGQRATLFRTPSGAYNSDVIELIEQCGMTAVQWDCDSVDYKDPTPDQMRDRILKRVRNGSIMLFHSGAKNTPDALPLVIDAVRDKGFQFAPVSELLLPPPYTVDFEGRQRKAT